MDWCANNLVKSERTSGFQLRKILFREPNQYNPRHLILYWTQRYGSAILIKKFEQEVVFLNLLTLGEIIYIIWPAVYRGELPFCWHLKRPAIYKLNRAYMRAGWRLHGSKRVPLILIVQTSFTHNTLPFRWKCTINSEILCMSIQR